MKKIYLSLLGAFLLFQVQAQVVINEVYGGGGNSGATYTHDFIELYNNSATSVSLSGWSVQYASSTGSNWSVTTLTGNIPANGFYLIQLDAGSGGTVPLPTPDAVGSTSMSSTKGKVALVNVATALSGTCPTGTQILDFVGFGSANCYEGSAPVGTLSNSSSAQRNTNGLDNNDNLADFFIAAPTPTNKNGVDITPPVLNSFTPINTATNVPTSFNAEMVFSENILAGTVGSIFIKKVSDNSVVTTIDVNSAAVSVTTNTAHVIVSGLALSTSYYIEITGQAFTDLAGNNFAGITGSAAWSFTTAASNAPATVGTTYSFNNCTGLITDGFTAFSAVGNQVWSCSTYGRDPNAPAGTDPFPYAVQINGYDNGMGSSVPNEDWLISAAYNLTATNIPLLSFYSRTAFNGLPLQLKVSTDYTGIGDPRNFTWTDINGRFPQQASNVWTWSDSINLSAFKSAHTYLAFVYSSSLTEGARWTVDDVIVFNANQNPAPAIISNTGNIDFGFVAANTSLVKTFSLTASDVTAAVNLTSNGAFLISKTNSNFTGSISFTQAEINNSSKTIYVQFLPTAANTNYASTINISSSAAANVQVTVNGNSIDETATLEVVNWNIEWFGSTVNGPTNEAQQLTNASNIAINIKADVFAFAEVVSESSLQTLVANLNAAFGANTYAYVLSDYGSHTNPFATNPAPLSEAQKLAFVYKTAVLSPIGTPEAFLANGVNTAADLANPAYNYFSSGRYPFMMRANVTLGAVTKEIRFILLHGKANTDPITTSYYRRKAGADTLHYSLNNLYPNDRIILLGDFNDDLDQSITAGFTTSSYSAFTGNPANFFSPTLALSLAGMKSTVGFSDMIDHVMLSNEMQDYYMNATADVLDEVSALVSNYGNTTSDHYPIFTRYAFDAAILPIALLDFSVRKNAQNVTINWRTANEHNSKEFLVQRSTDNGVHWETIKTIAAAGYSQNILIYNCVDYNPAKGLNLYRLKSVDVDSRFSLSESKPVFFAENVQANIWPNPASAEINIQFKNADVSSKKVLLFDINGKQVKKINSLSSRIKINLAGLSKGTYILQINSAYSQTTEKIIVQ